MGRKIFETLRAGQKTSHQWEYTYEEGNLKKSKDPIGRICTYTYDSHGRLLEEKVAGWERIYTYDPRGLLTSVEQIGTQNTSWISSWFTTPHQEHSTIERSYDPDGHLKKECIYLNSNLIQETDQEVEGSKRTLQIGDHERTFTYQNNQLSQVATKNINLTYTYTRSGLLRSKESPLTITVTDYNFSALPEMISTFLPEESFPRIFRVEPLRKALNLFHLLIGKTVYLHPTRLFTNSRRRELRI